MSAAIHQDDQPEPPVATGLSQSPAASHAPARLILAATPIGTPQDASFRLAAALSAAPLIAAEDTRRLRRLAGLRDERRTMVFFESPRRLAKTLADMAAAFGPGRSAAVCRELTKTHEEIRRGSLEELERWASHGVLGEITLVIAGAPAPGDRGAGDARDAAAKVAAAEQAGSTRKEAITLVAAELGLLRREVYDAVVQAKPR